jgi:hypothetical protein
MELSKLLSNKFVRITLLVFFFLFIYKILFAIGVFFGIDSNILSMYLCWISMLLLFGALLPITKTNFNVKKKAELFPAKAIAETIPIVAPSLAPLIAPKN